MILLKNAELHVGDGRVLQNHDLLIDHGKITEIGTDLDISNIKASIDVVDCEGKVAIPGFIEPLSTMGCSDFLINTLKDTNENIYPISPRNNPKYAFDPAEIMMQKLYDRGTTTIGLYPGDTNVIGGYTAAFSTYGDNSKKMFLRSEMAVKGSVSTAVKNYFGHAGKKPMTMMGIFSILKKAFKDALLYEKSNNEYDEDKEIILKVIKGEIPFFVTANNEMEINALYEIIEEYDVDLVICGAYQAGSCKENILKHKSSIIVGNLNIQSRRINKGTRVEDFVEFSNKGILLGLSSSSDIGGGDRESLLWMGIHLYRAGMESEDVIKTLTLNNAKLLKINDLVGTLEINKLANIGIYSKNPIENYDATIDMVIINGDIVHRGGKLCC